jgi:hypothetical protein
MRTLAVLLWFTLCGPCEREDCPIDNCEHGHVAAASCAAAEAYVRGGMRSDQNLYIIECRE